MIPAKWFSKAGSSGSVSIQEFIYELGQSETLEFKFMSAAHCFSPDRALKRDCNQFTKPRLQEIFISLKEILVWSFVHFLNQPPPLSLCAKSQVLLWSTFHCLRYVLRAHPPLRTASLCAPEFISLNKLTSVLLNGRIYVWFVTSNSFCSILLFLDGSCQSSDNYSSNLFHRFICPEMFQEIRMWVWGVCVCVGVGVCVTSVLKTYTLLFGKARSKH